MPPYHTQQSLLNLDGTWLLTTWSWVRFPQTAPNCWYSFRYGDVLPCDSLPSLMFAPLVICEIINGSSDYGGANRTPTPMPKSVQTKFLENICNLKSSENMLVFSIPDAVVLFIGSQFTVIKLLECLEHNLIRSLSPRSHSLESYLSN
jgi:hypothetical protein